MIETKDSPISQFYCDKTIFLTGATGLLGTVLCCKLLLETDVAHVYALVRGGES